MRAGHVNLSRFFTIYCLIVCSFFCLQPSIFAAESEETWEQILIDGNPAGYRKSARSVGQDGELTFTSNEHLEVSRFGQTIAIDATHVTVQSADGNVKSFQFEMDNKPLMSITSSGVRDGKVMKVTTGTGNSQAKKEIPWNDDFMSADYASYLLETKPLKKGDVRQMKVFMAEYSQIATITHTGQGEVVVKDKAGKERTYNVILEKSSLLPGTVSKVFLDAKNKFVRSEVQQMGMNLVTQATTKEIALTEIMPKMIDIGMNSLVKPTPPLEKGHRTRHAMYSLSVPSSSSISQIPSGRYQKVTEKKSGDQRIIQIEIDAEGKFPVNPEADLNQVKPDEYLASSLYLELKDPELMALAKAINVTGTPGEKALALEKEVFKRLNRKDFSTAFATAAEVAKSLQGDCTEHAVLLAALLRVKEIPSRVCVGLVYVDALNSFGGHMWTEAWVGDRWLPVDATLGQGGIGAGHIKLAQSSLAGESPFPIALFLPTIELMQGLKIQVKSQE